MTEAFIHHLWKYRLFTSVLTTTAGETVDVLSPGIHNHNAGPDFSDARLRIGETLWAGNVEIHINSSDWQRHGHHKDPAYDNVILHLVLNHDAGDSESGIPVAVIYNKFDPGLYLNYQAFLTGRNWVPCFKQIGSTDKTEISLWLERMLIERLEHKAAYLEDFLEASENDWEGVLYMVLARSFGFGLNALPFEMLARSLPYRIVARHKDNPMQVEALILGQAGLLGHHLTDPWPQLLFNEYAFLRKKYSLVPVQGHSWRFMRLRPVSFPTIRLAQFASLLCNHNGLFAEILQSGSAGCLTGLMNATASDFWDTHYHFSKTSLPRKKSLGQSSAKLLVINAVLPLMFVFGRATGNDELCNRSLTFYTQLEGEVNRITLNWKAAGLDVSTAFNTQALIEMKASYCDNFRCLDCRIGNLILRNHG